MKSIAKIAIVSALSALSFWLGRLSISYQVVTYHSVLGIPEAFPRDDPGYGLPMATYAAVLSEFRGTNSHKAFEDFEGMLDDVVERAEYRRPLLDGWRLEQFDKGLGWAARYRSQYPRPLSQGTGFYWTADKQTEVDKFLAGFAK
jgi:hypothetical protein